MKARFEEAGGTVMDHTAFRTADLYRDAVVIQTASTTGSAPAATSADAQPSGAYHGLDAQDHPAGEHLQYLQATNCISATSLFGLKDCWCC